MTQGHPETRKEVASLAQRKHEIKVRLSDSELSQLNEKVRRSKLSREKYLRFLIAGKQPQAVPPAEYFELQKQLSGIGRNLNQLTKIAHATNSIQEVEIKKVLDEFCKFMKRMEAAVLLPREIEDLPEDQSDLKKN